jgi:ketosteroid isomerase-like protein
MAGHQKVVREFYEALQANDFDSLSGMCLPDVKWALPLPRDHASDTTHYRVHKIVECGDQVTAFGFRHSAGATQEGVPFASIFEFRAGRIAEIREVIAAESTAPDPEPSVLDADPYGLAHAAGTALASGYDFASVSQVTALGQDIGVLLGPVLRTYNQVTGVFYLPLSEVDRTRAQLATMDVPGKYAVITGDPAKSVPGGSDVLLLHQVLRWLQDDEVLEILKNCRTVMHLCARLLLVEQTENEQVAGPRGRWRSQQDCAALLASAGLKLTRAVPIGHGLAALEAVPIHTEHFA